MQKVLFAVPILLLALLGACSGGKSSASSGMADTYYPLDIGNKWVYVFTAGQQPVRQTIEVVGTKEIEGIEYSHVVTTYDERSDRGERLLRSEGSQVYEYNSVDKFEYMFIDFERTEEDTSNFLLGFVEDPTGQPVTVPAGMFPDCIRVAFPGVDSQILNMAPGVGLISAFWFRGNKELVEAVINGKKYPDS